MKQKEDVFHPMNMVNTVGQEIEKILIREGHDPNEFLRVDKLRQCKHFTDKEIDRLCELVGDKELHYFIREYQTDYAEQRIECEVAYAKSKMDFAKLWCVLPLLENEFNKGRDRLSDIIDFFGVKSEEEIFTNAAHHEERFDHLFKVKADPIKLYGWVRRCELDAKTQELHEYDPRALQTFVEEGHWRETLNDMHLLHPLQDHFAELGVAIVALPLLPGTIIEGDQNKVFIDIELREHHPIVMVVTGDGDYLHADLWIAIFDEIKKELLPRHH